MIENTCLVVDIWEGQALVDFDVLKKNGVAGVGIRLNDMNGGHHLDAMFQKHWAAAGEMVRFPYFVYNPWVSGAENFYWLVEHLPLGCSTVAIDIEVRYSTYPANKYAGEVEIFLNACRARGIKTIIYTGAGFLNLLSKWPKVDYWWAQYPSPSYYFSGVKTWEELRLRLANLDLPFNASVIPGTCKMWQFSGDYLVLPGSIRDLDVNIFYGSEQQLAEYFGTAMSEPPVKIPSGETGYYAFSSESLWQRPDGGPLVTPHYDITKTSGNKDVPLEPPYQKWIRSMNNAVQYGKIIAPDWGPSKGVNENGILKLNALVYPGRNIVKIRQVVIGLDGQKWGLLETVNKTGSVPDTTVNHVDTPHLVHTVYGSNSRWSYFSLDNAPRVPLIASGDRWVQMKWLERIALPKVVTITVRAGVNVRVTPGDLTTRNGVKSWAEKVEILEIVTAKGGIWGRIKNGWIALRYNDKNLTDWMI